MSYYRYLSPSLLSLLLFNYSIQLDIIFMIQTRMLRFVVTILHGKPCCKRFVFAGSVASYTNFGQVRLESPPGSGYTPLHSSVVSIPRYQFLFHLFTQTNMMLVHEVQRLCPSQGISFCFIYSLKPT